MSRHRIHSIKLATGEITTVAGTGVAGFRNGAGNSAQFNHPSGVAINPSGSFALVSVHPPASPPCRVRL
jgi:hypothetical protein